MNTKPENNFSSPHFLIYLLSFIVAVLNSCILSPVYIQIESNITFEYSALPIVLNYVIIAFDILYISLLVAALTYSVYAIQQGTESKRRIIVFTTAIVFLKHALNLTASSIIDSYIDISFDIPLTLFSITIDLLLLLAVALITNNKCQKHFAHVKAMQKASKYLQAVEYNEMDDIYPFKGFFAVKDHAILIPILTGSLITTGLLIVQRLYADFVVLGAPSSLFEVGDIVISYVTDLLFGLLAYTISYFAVSFIFLRNSIQK